MKISVVMPVYNEAATIRRIVDRVLAAPFRTELIIVDDGSTDQTPTILATVSDTVSAVKVLRHPVNRGKGAALRTGFAAATGDIVLVQDADLEYDPGQYPALLQPLLGGEADVVFGSRFAGQHHRKRYFWHTFGNWLLTTISNSLTGLNLTDMETCYKVFPRHLLDRIELQEDGFGFEPEFTAKIARLRRDDGSPLRIVEVPVTYDRRGFDEGKKIGLADAVHAIRCIFRYRR